MAPFPRSWSPEYPQALTLFHRGLQTTYLVFKDDAPIPTLMSEPRPLTSGQHRASAAPAQGPECTRSGPPAEGHPPSCHLNSNGRATNTKKEAPPGLGLRPKRLSPHPGFWSWSYSSRQSAIGPQPTSECIRTRRGRSTGSGCSFTGCCR